MSASFLVLCHITHQLALPERMGWTSDLAAAGRYDERSADRAAETMLDGKHSAIGIVAAPTGDWSTPTEPVLGEQLAIGDVVRNHGYRWLIVEVSHDPMTGHIPALEQGRFCVHAKAIDAPDLPSGYRNEMTMGLRVDLHWHRENPGEAL